MVIGNGPKPVPGQVPGVAQATRLFWIKQHSNLSIQNTVTENFAEDVLIDWGGHTGIISLINNHFNGKVTVKNAMVVSMGNQFGFPGILPYVQAIAENTAYIFSFGDKLCPYNNSCSNKWQISPNSKLFSIDPFNTVLNGDVKINNDGSITYGSKLFADLGTTAEPGTVVYCSNCQQANPCSQASSGGGAMAKRIGGNWICN